MERRLLVAALFVVGLGAAGHLLWDLGAPPPPDVPTPVAPAQSAALVEPAVRHPVDSPSAPLPALEASDLLFGRELAEALGTGALPAGVYPEQMIRRLVATVDNLPRERAAARLMPVQPVPGMFRVNGGEQALFAAAANSLRYQLYVGLAEQADTARLVALYRKWYPLFQQAYVELGYPKGYFNDRLVEAIDDLLEAPETPGRMALIQPHVLYQFADPELERLSAGQKILVRMGNENAARMKRVLRDIRERLASPNLAR